MRVNRSCIVDAHGTWLLRHGERSDRSAGVPPAMVVAAPTPTGRGRYKIADGRAPDEL
ncbi:MAG: hypothetical protein AB1Z65_11550 [Candidatus Sulfomarinibacteraceae bacterium]